MSREDSLVPQCGESRPTSEIILASLGFLHTVVALVAKMQRTEVNPENREQKRNAIVK